MSKDKTYHFIKYEYGTVEANDEQEASHMAVHPMAPKESMILTLISKNIGIPVFPNLGHEELIERISNLETAIMWKEEHFEQKAKELENIVGHLLFERGNFMKALYQMIANHNRSEGISWNTVEYYLHEFCLKE